MQKLETGKQMPLSKEAVGKILDLYSLSDFTFQLIAEGIANTSLVIESEGKKYVLRIYAQDRRSDEEIVFEVSFQDYLRTHGIPIPIIYPNTEGKELSIIEMEGKRWQAILMAFAEGQSVTLRPSRELLAALAKLQAKMHLLGREFAKNTDGPKDLWEDLRDTLTEKIEHLPIKDQKVLDLIDRVKTYRYPLDSELPYGYNHLDIDFDGNVLTKDDRVSAIVDFEDVQYSPIIVCLGFSLWNILDDEGIEAMRYYLKEYESVRPLTKIEREALPHAVFFRNYAIAMVRLLLWDENTPVTDIEDILHLEKEIPKLLQPDNL